jgi:hypothetical protein
LAQQRVVIAGLDPAIHLLRKEFLRRKMDPRVKPAGDACGAMNQISWKTLQRLIADY